jgi:O-antigen/teichoic acid export membrane protein
MASLRTNFLANVAGKGWIALLSFAFIPVYIGFLGIEAYGLIGVYLTLYAVSSLLDLGMGMALNRELARYSAQPGAARDMRDLLRTLEVVYWSVGVLLGLAFALLGPAFAGRWIQPGGLPPETLDASLRLMGVALACQWPLALYTGGLVGLQRQVLSNSIAAAATTLRNFGAVLVLWQFSASVEAFFVWQIVASLAESLFTAAATWRALPAGPGGRFRADLAASVWRFAAGVSGISVFSVILTQIDKILLSGLLPLAGFGYYMVASRLAGGLYYLVAPVISTYFPRFAQLMEARDERELRRTYHQSCQLMSFLLLPPAALLVFFPHDILRLWTQSLEVADQAATILALLAAGTALNGLASMPHVLQLASGWTRLGLINAAATTVLLAPLVIFATGRYGGAGAAAVWLLLNLGNLLVNAVFTHRRLLAGELWPWLRADVAPVLLAVAGAAGACKWLLPDGAGVPALACAALAILAAAALASPEIRRLAMQRLKSSAAPAS